MGVSRSTPPVCVLRAVPPWASIAVKCCFGYERLALYGMRGGPAGTVEKRYVRDRLTDEIPMCVDRKEPDDPAVHALSARWGVEDARVVGALVLYVSIPAVAGARHGTFR